MRRRVCSYLLCNRMAGSSLFTLSLGCMIFFEFSRYSNGASFIRSEVLSGRSFSNEGQWLFGTLTCSADALPIDEMLAHQLHQSASRHFNHRVLYVSSIGSIEERRRHSNLLQKVQDQNLIDQVVNVNNVGNVYELATRVMEEKTARAFVDLDFAVDYNKAMLAFLLKCIDGGYDHCVWLDPDIFVHRGQVPWVDEAVQLSQQKPRLVYSLPRGAAGSFSSRYFVYHREALQHLLPLTSDAPESPLDTFEALVQDNMQRKFGNDVQDEFGKTRGESWVIHPPDSKSDVHSMLHMCASEDRSMHTLISIVEQGSEDGEDAFSWRDTKNNNENMDLSGWEAHLAHRCDSRDFWK